MALFLFRKMYPIIIVGFVRSNNTLFYIYFSNHVTLCNVSRGTNNGYKMAMSFRMYRYKRKDTPIFLVVCSENREEKTNEIPRIR